MYLLRIVVLTVALFNSLKQTAGIWLAVPLADFNTQRGEGNDPIDAVRDSAVNRLRPVGLAPLFQGAFFVSMAVTIAFARGFATILTMVVVPFLYSTVYRIRAS